MKQRLHALTKRMGAFRDELVRYDRADLVEEEEVGAERDEGERECPESSRSTALSKKETEAEGDDEDDQGEEVQKTERPVVRPGAAGLPSQPISASQRDSRRTSR